MLGQKNKRHVLEVLPFKDGQCKIYTIEKRTIDKCLGTFDFHNETVGIKAYTEFNVLGIEVERAISIPENDVAQVGRVLKINDESNFYQIVLIQHKDTFPRSLRLTLAKANIQWSEAV